MRCECVKRNDCSWLVLYDEEEEVGREVGQALRVTCLNNRERPS